MGMGCPTCFEVYSNRSNRGTGTMVKFCPKDGMQLVSVKCPACGNPDLNDEDRYCIFCGVEIDYAKLVNDALTQVTA